jgi:hypothetical protein
MYDISTLGSPVDVSGVWLARPQFFLPPRTQFF